MSTHIITGSTIDHLSTLPLVYRRNPTVCDITKRIIEKNSSFLFCRFSNIWSTDWFFFQPQLVPPPVDPNESKHGLLSLIERGLIPPTAKITFDQFPIKNQPPEKSATSNKGDATADKNVTAKFKSNGKIDSINDIRLLIDLIQIFFFLDLFMFPELVYKLDPNYDPAKTVNNKENANPSESSGSRQTAINNDGNVAKKKRSLSKRLKPVRTNMENQQLVDNSINQPSVW